MKHIFAVLTIATLLVSCQKTWPPIPGKPNPIPEKQEMEYTDVNIEIKKGKSLQIDVDKNGTKDILFSTLLVGDPIYQQDKLQFFVQGSQYTYFLMGPDETSPIYNKSALIPIDNQSQHTWFDISFEILAEKVTPVTGDIFWKGQWKNVSKKYFGFQVKRNDKFYLGWIELSFSIPEEKLTVHRLAIRRLLIRILLRGSNESQKSKLKSQKGRVNYTKSHEIRGSFLTFEFLLLTFK